MCFQILGAEKALFRALKSKHDTPKYGLIYHASLIGQAAPKHKGKISRVLAAKCALSIRVDALSQGDVPNVGIEHRLAVENRLRQLEGGVVTQMSGTAKGKAGAKKYEGAAKEGGTGKAVKGYSDAADETIAKKKDKKKKKDESENEPKEMEEAPQKDKKKKRKEPESEDDEEKPKKKTKKDSEKKKRKDNSDSD